MNNWYICWFFTHTLVGILIFKGLNARRLYESFGVKGLISLQYQNSLNFAMRDACNVAFRNFANAPKSEC
jgi:hypothetical protein